MSKKCKDSSKKTKKTDLKNSIKLTTDHIVAENKPSCFICTENYNRSSRLMIPCEYCNFEACRECCERYLLMENEPKCMNNECNRQWTNEFISKRFTKKFVNNDLKAHREKTLFDKQRALLPATQPFVENILKREDYHRKINEAAELVNKARVEMNRIQNEYYRFINTAPATQERATFTRACPDAECRGFLSTQWKCGLCNKWSCPTCHEVKGLDRDCEHTCNPDSVATANLLNSDTKPCPKCGEGIFKIDGCSQMWCTQCHTAFCWRTGRIETVIHNPHYYEWMRRNGTLERNPNDIQCGREINHATSVVIRNTMAEKERTDSANAAKIKTLTQSIIEVTRRIIHLRYAALPRYQYNTDDVTQKLRIQYMRKFINEDNFKIALQKENKRSNKYREISEVIQLLINTLTDIIYRFVDEIKSPAWTYNLDRLNEVDQIVRYADECFLKISRTYGSTPLNYRRL